MREVSLKRRQSDWVGEFHAMGSPCEILCETPDELDAYHLAIAACTEAWRIEDKYSRYIDGNIVSAINTARGAAVEIDDETARLIDFARTLYELSEHRFDITSGGLRRVWTFDGSANIPDPDAVASARQLVGWHRVTWESQSLRMPAGMEIDLGGIGKEYAVDRVAGILHEHCGVSCLVNFGGDIALTGFPERKPHWVVGIESVDAGGEVAELAIRLRAGAIATSGDARRFLLRDGKRYGHILDPLSGWPVEDAPRSVTVAAETCVQAGMLSTLAMLRGAGAEEFLEDAEARFWCYR